ncbi:MAG: hypothetical protein ACM3N6_03050 [Betaproteobacteria bacterium]
MDRSDEPSTEAKLAFLRAGHPGCEVVETHMAWVLLDAVHALKLKKPVRYPFLDFSTVAAREADARAELRLNRRLASGVYLGLLALQWDGERFALVPEDRLPGPGRTVDWLVLMRRLPAARMLDHLLRDGVVEPARIDTLADVLVDFYRRAPRAAVEADELVARLREERRIDREVLTQPAFALAEAPALLQRFDAACSAAAPLLHERVRAGRIVEGHGDLRPEHVCLVEPPVVIDCLEFNAALREVDPFEELAFLGLECALLGAPWVGPRLVARCGQALADRPPAPLLDLYVARRALLRARLAAAHLLEAAPRTPERWLPQARRYLARAQAALDGFSAASPHGST